MTPLLALLFATALLCGLNGCKPGGGGGGTPPPGGTVLDFNAKPIIAKGGEVLAVAAPAPILALGSDYTVQWRSSGAIVASARARAATASTLALPVPLVPTGAYVADVLLEHATGRILVELTEAAVVADAPALVDGMSAQWVARATSLRAEAQADPNAARRAARLADLNQIDAWMQAFTAARQAASPADLAQVAVLLASNPSLHAESSVAALDETAQLALIAAETLRARARSVAGVAAVTIGVTAGLQPLASTALVVGGLLAIAVALPLSDQAIGRVVRPIDDLILQLGSPGGGGVASPAPLARGSGQPTLRLAAATPFGLGGDANFGSLSVADRASDHAAMQAVFRELDLLEAVFPGLDPAVAALVTSRPAAAPTQPTIERAAVDAARIGIESQGNPQVVFLLANGLLTATLQGVSAPVTTTATFGYDAGDLGSLSRLVTIEIIEPPNMVPIAAGTFSMGSPMPLLVAPYGNQATSQPVHAVAITRPLWVGRYEVTQAEYQAVMGGNPSLLVGPQLPVEMVTWHDAMAYCAALTLSESAAGRVPVGYQYRLPTEAEWEYCCRAGTTTEYWLGSMIQCWQANFRRSLHRQFSSSDCGSRQTANVGSYPGNAWGLHDTAGNVAEWCLDSWDGSANYPSAQVSDPLVTSGADRIVRGGSWISDSGSCRAAQRGVSVPGFARSDIGFRVVLGPALVP